MILRSILRLLGRFFRGRKARDEPRPLTSFVLLLRRPVSLAAEDIERAARRLDDMPGYAGKVRVVPAPVPGGFIVTFGEAVVLFLLSRPDTYADLGETAKRIEDSALRDRWWEHTAWLAVDVSMDRGHASFADSVRCAARLAEAFIDDNCVLFFVPSMERFSPVDSELHAKLLAPDPFGAATLNRDGTIFNARSEDEELNNAMEEARRQLPQFVEAFKKRVDETGRFMLKVRFDEPGIAPEHIWILVESAGEDQITGTLENRPNHLKSVQHKMRVTVSRDSVSDWMYLEGGEMHGGFVERLLRKRAE